MTTEVSNCKTERQFRIKKTARGSVNIVKMIGSDRLCAFSAPNSRRRKLLITDSDKEIQGQ